MVLVTNHIWPAGMGAIGEGGGDGAATEVLPQISKPLPLTEPSENHVNVSPPLIWTLEKPVVPL